MSDSHLPPALRRRSDRESVAEDIAPYLGTSADERSRILSDLCRFAAEAIDQNPLRERILEFQEPRSEESLRVWNRLMKRARNG